MNERVKKILARPEVLMMGPVLSPVSGVKFPVYTAAKMIYSYPDTLDVLGEEMGEICEKIGAKKIVGGETSGIIIATAISMKTRIPMCYVRKEKKEPPRYGVEGVIKKGEKVVLIDDSMVTGRDKLLFLDNIESMGGIVSDMVIMVDVPMWGRTKERQKIVAKGIKIHSLGLWAEWFVALYEAGYLSKALFDVAWDAANDIVSWQGDSEEAKKKWQWFEEVKNKQGGKFV